MKLLNNVKTKWDISSNFCYLLRISDFERQRSYIFRAFGQDLKEFDFLNLIVITDFKIRIIFAEKKIVIFEGPNFFLERYIMRSYYTR